MAAKQQFQPLKSTLGLLDLKELSALDNYLQEKNDNSLANTFAESRFS